MSKNNGYDYDISSYWILKWPLNKVTKDPMAMDKQVSPWFSYSMNPVLRGQGSAVFINRLSIYVCFLSDCLAL